MKVFGALALSVIISLGVVWGTTRQFQPSGGFQSEEELCQAIGGGSVMFLGRCISLTSTFMLWALASVTLSAIVALVP